MSIKEVLALPPVQAVALSVAAAGGRAWLVGGAVRDALLGRMNKDLDLEVHGLDAGTLGRVLGGLGRPKAVGRSFGVYKLVLRGLELDVALPRGDSTAGDRGTVVGDPSLPIDEACRRRDLTINAIAADPLTGAICDPTGGRADLAARELRAVAADRFGDDPARALRVARFAGVLGFSVVPDLAALCRRQDLAAVPGERLLPELEKLLLQATAPSRGIAVARDTGVLDQIFGALAPDAGALDRAAAATRDWQPAAQRLGVLLAVLLVGAAEPEAALDRLRLHSMGGVAVRDIVLGSIAHHADVPPGGEAVALRTLAEQVAVPPVLATAAALRPALDLDRRLAQAQAAGVAEGPLPTLLLGRDLIQAGLRPGPTLGLRLRAVRAAQLAGRVADRDSALALALAWQPDAAPAEPDAGPAGR